jgi:hypothetical protein
MDEKVYLAVQHSLRDGLGDEQVDVKWLEHDPDALLRMPKSVQEGLRGMTQIRMRKFPEINWLHVTLS